MTRRRRIEMSWKKPNGPSLTLLLVAACVLAAPALVAAEATDLEAPAEIHGLEIRREKGEECRENRDRHGTNARNTRDRSNAS